MNTRATAGLCASCAWVRIVDNRRGSRFFLCRRSENDPRYAKYPGLPVTSCQGYELRPDSPPGQTNLPEDPA